MCHVLHRKRRTACHGHRRVEFVYILETTPCTCNTQVGRPSTSTSKQHAGAAHPPAEHEYLSLMCDCLTKETKDRPSISDDAKRLQSITGGRFCESYYWDSYWIVRGLICERHVRHGHRRRR